MSDDELAQVDGKNAGGIAKMLVAKGSMSVWQYAVHKSAAGDLEQAPLHKIGLIATDVAARRALRDAAESRCRSTRPGNSGPGPDDAIPRFGGARTRGPECAFLRAARRF